MTATVSERQRKLVQKGAKGVAPRWLTEGNDFEAEKAAFRSAVKRFGGKSAETPDPQPVNPQTHAHKRSIRAEQAAIGMMSPPPGTFDEKTITSWLGKMNAEDLGKLSRLTALAREGRGQAKAAWTKLDQGLAQRGMHIEVHGGTVNISTSPPYTPYQPTRKNNADNWGRHMAKIKDFINGR